MAYLFYPCLKDITNKDDLLAFAKEVEKDLNKIYNSDVPCWGSFASPYLAVNSDDEEVVLNIFSKLNEHLVKNHSSILPLVKDNKPYTLAKLDLVDTSTK